MEVYAIIYDWADNYENDCNVKLFDNKENALKFMKEIIKEIKTEYGYNDFYKDDKEFYGYNEGSYAEKHDRVRIEKIKINEEVK